MSYIAKGRSPAARGRLQALGEGEMVCISSITEAELRYGLAKRPEARLLWKAIEGLLFRLRILAWGSKEAAAYGELRAKLEAAGITLSELDLQIGAHALAIGAVLVTNDKAFLRINELDKIENWALDL